MTESDKSFEAYLDEVIEHAGQVGKRRNLRTLEWRRIAEEIWVDCVERRNVASTGKCTTVGGEKLPG